MIESVKSLADSEVLSRLPQLRQVERESMAAVVSHVAVVDARQLYAEAGFSSMFAYLTRGLGYSEEAAMRRLKVARLVQRFPRVHDALVDGRLHLTAASLLAREMDASNAEALIAAAAHQTRRAIEGMLAERAPKPDAPTQTRRLPTPRPAATPERSLFDPHKPYLSQAGSPRAATTATTPLGQARYKVSFTASARLMGKLEQLGALLSHTTSRDLPGQLEAAVDVALDVLHKRRFGAKTPRASKPVAPGSRHIPLAVRGAVHERDGGRCTFVAPGGRRCDSTRRLQLDHIVPFAMGGPSAVDNLRLRCQTHNLLEARRVFGPRRPQGALGLTG